MGLGTGLHPGAPCLHNLQGVHGGPVAGKVEQPCSSVPGILLRIFCLVGTVPKAMSSVASLCLP